MPTPPHKKTLNLIRAGTMLKSSASKFAPERRGRFAEISRMRRVMANSVFRVCTSTWPSPQKSSQKSTCTSRESNPGPPGSESVCATVGLTPHVQAELLGASHGPQKRALPGHRSESSSSHHSSSKVIIFVNNNHYL